MRNEVFEIASSNARWGIFALGLIPTLVGQGLMASGLKTPRFEITDTGLRLSGDFYGSFIPASELNLEQSRLVDLTQEQTLMPRIRTFGTGLPGYNTGWFTLRNGTKALLHLTNRTQVIYVPTTAGYSVLVSPKDPAGLLAQLKKLT